MDKKTISSLQLKRREFLLTLGLGGAAAAAAVGGRLITAATDDDQEKKQPASQGYRLTGHVQNYYRTPRI